jgi:hypothetical protein
LSRRCAAATLSRGPWSHRRAVTTVCRPTGDLVLKQALLLAVACAATLAASGATANAQLEKSTAATPAPYPTNNVGAHARFSKARINVGAPDLNLTAAFIAAGGGATAFDAQTFLTSLTGSSAASQTETAALTKRFGADTLASFSKTFDYFVTDALAQATSGGFVLPTTLSPDPADAKAFAAGLYAAGEGPHAGFDTEYMLDTLFTHVIHVAVMNDIDANPDLGPKADANFHAILTQVMADVKSRDKF